MLVMGWVWVCPGARGAVVVKIVTLNSSCGEAACQNPQLCFLGCYTETH